MKAWLTALFLVTPACTDSLDLGSDVVWYSDHETGDLRDWTDDGKGGFYVSDDSATCALATDEAHSGQYAVKLATTATGADSVAGLYRIVDAETEAYFSAWYFLPRSHAIVGTWTILRFRSASPELADSDTLSCDLNLRSLPNQSLALSIVEQRQAYLAWPLAIPTPVVPVLQWFQIEARFRSRSDETGLLKVWLDGQLVYDIQGRVTGQGDSVYFNPCNETNVMNPSNVELYVDDVMVSRSRITENGSP